jgi:hypothetical protein
MDTIRKADLIDGKYYIGRTIQRGMYVGQWDKRTDLFLCIKHEFMGPVLYNMNHIEDEEQGFLPGTTFEAFDPVRLIETP